MIRHSAAWMAALAILVVGTAAFASGADEVRLQRALDRPVDIQLSNTPLTGIFAKLSKATGVKFTIDPDTFAYLPYGEQTRLDVTIEKFRLRDALTRMLAQQALRWEVDKEAVRILPSEPLYRMERRASFRELRTLGVLSTLELTTSEGSAGPLDQLRTATSNRALRLVLPIKADRDAALKQAAGALPGTGVQWLDRLCQGHDWTWYLDGNDINVIPSTEQVKRQLQRHISLKYTDDQIFTVLQDIARKTRIALRVQPGTLQLLPAGIREGFTLKMADVSAAEALQAIRGFTGLEFDIVPSGIDVKPSKMLLARSDSVSASPARQRPRFFVRSEIKLDTGRAVMVFIPSDQLPEKLQKAIEAQNAETIRQLQVKLGVTP